MKYDIGSGYIRLITLLILRVIGQNLIDIVYETGESDSKIHWFNNVYRHEK